GWAAGVGRLPAAVNWTLSAAVCALLAWDLGLPRFVLPVTPVDALPPVYGWLAEHGAGQPLLELPVRSWRGDVVGNLREQRYAWASMRHWLPHLSGRSGYFPPSYDLILPMARPVRTRGRRTWPRPALAPDRLVLLRTQWRGSSGRQVGPPLPALRLTADGPPGEEVSVYAMVPVPPAPGRYRLVVRTVQGGR